MIALSVDEQREESAVNTILSLRIQLNQTESLLNKIKMWLPEDLSKTAFSVMMIIINQLIF